MPTTRSQPPPRLQQNGDGDFTMSSAPVTQATTRDTDMDGHNRDDDQAMSREEEDRLYGTPPADDGQQNSTSSDDNATGGQGLDVQFQDLATASRGAHAEKSTTAPPASTTGKRPREHDSSSSMHAIKDTPMTTTSVTGHDNETGDIDVAIATHNDTERDQAFDVRPLNDEERQAIKMEEEHQQLIASSNEAKRIRAPQALAMPGDAAETLRLEQEEQKLLQLAAQPWAQGIVIPEGVTRTPVNLMLEAARSCRRTNDNATSPRSPSRICLSASKTEMIFAFLLHTADYREYDTVFIPKWHKTRQTDHAGPFEHFFDLAPFEIRGNATRPSLSQEMRVAPFHHRFSLPPALSIKDKAQQAEVRRNFLSALLNHLTKQLIPPAAMKSYIGQCLIHFRTFGKTSRFLDVSWPDGAPSLDHLCLDIPTGNGKMGSVIWYCRGSYAHFAIRAMDFDTGTPEQPQTIIDALHELQTQMIVLDLWRILTIEPYTKGVVTEDALQSDMTGDIVKPNFLPKYRAVVLFLNGHRASINSDGHKVLYSDDPASLAFRTSGWLPLHQRDVELSYQDRARWCSACKNKVKDVHDRDKCPNTKCDYCGTPGHFKRNCAKRAHDNEKAGAKEAKGNKGGKSKTKSDTTASTGVSNLGNQPGKAPMAPPLA